MARALERGLGARTLRIATGLGRYWEARSAATEGRNWLDQALAAGLAEERARAAAWYWAGTLAFFQGDLSAADRSLAEAARVSEALQEVFLEATARAYLGWVARERGDPEAGRAQLEKSQILLEQLDDAWERSEVLLPFAAAEVEVAGPENKAAAIFGDVLALKREAGDVIATSDSLNNVGWDALLTGDFELAASYLDEAAAIARELGDTFRITLAVCNLGLAAVLQERYDEAVERLRETLLLTIRRGDRRCGAEAVLGLAAAVAGLGADELSVKLDFIRRALMAEAGIVYTPLMLERLEPILSLARERLGPERVTTLEAGVGAPTLELALELLDAS